MSNLASAEKARRTMHVAALLHAVWPRRLTRQEIAEQVPMYGKSARQRAVQRDIETLSGLQLDALPEPEMDANELEAWYEEQQQSHHLAITYERHSKTFGLARPSFCLDISEEEARAFVALLESFVPGAPYAGPVQHLLRRWEWLFTEKSRRLVEQKRKLHEHARPVLLPLSPVVDYSQHEQIILELDAALEVGAYVSFAYTPLTQSWDDEPTWHSRTEPYELEYRDGHWYYTAYARDVGLFLDYRVDRIRPGSLSKALDRFFPGIHHRRGAKIQYWVSPMLARHNSLSARLSEQRVTMLENERGAIVEGYAKSLWWARRLLLGYGEQAKALEPEELVKMMSETVLAMGRLYEDGQRLSGKDSE